MNPVEPVAKYDPNEPDCTNGDFFCRLCLSSMNSESMWSSHIAGKRHIKNAQKYPNGLPRGFDDEDSYERPPKRERFDDYEYDGHDEYPPTYDDMFVDNYRRKGPPMDYVPTIKPNLVFDYGHTKKLEETVLPPERNRVPVIPPPVAVPSVSAIPPRSPDVTAESFISILDQILQKTGTEKPKPEVKDDFFEKLNQREMAKDIAKELSKKCIYANNDKKSDDDQKTKSTRKAFNKSDKRKPDIFDILHETNDKKLFTIKYEEEPKRKSSSSKPSSSKSKSKLKSELDDLDPDELTPDMLDALLSARLKPKKSDSTDEICNKKHCVKNEVNLDDPKFLAEKLQSLSTKTFLEVIHKKIVNLDLKSPEELKMLLKVIADAQAAVCKKLPPELQSLVKATLSGNVADNTHPPAQDTAISQNQPVASSIPSNTISQNSVNSSSQALSNIKSILKSASPQTPSAQLSKLASSPISNVPVSRNQNSATLVSNVAFPQNQFQVPFSFSSSLTNTSPAMPSTPIAAITSVPSTAMTSMPPAAMMSMPPAAMMSMPPSALTSMPTASIPAPLTSVTSPNNQAAWQNMQANAIHNYYNKIFSMYQNRQVVPPNVPNMNVNRQPSPRFLQPPPPPPPPPTRLTLSQEISNAIAKLEAQRKVPAGQSKQESSVSDDSQAKRNKEMLDTLKKLEALENEFKKKKLNSKK